jgi:hypothetical protein
MAMLFQIDLAGRTNPLAIANGVTTFFSAALCSRFAFGRLGATEVNGTGLLCPIYPLRVQCTDDELK